MTCYAWRKGEGEKLYSHLVETYRVAKQMWELEALSKKVSKLTGLEREACREAVLAAALLHDIGKASVTYQKECAKGECEEFRQHYLVSTLYTYIALKEGVGIAPPTDPRTLAEMLSGRREGEREEVMALLVLLPIALHHYHQIRSYGSLEYSGDEASTRKHHAIYSGCGGCVEELARFIDENFDSLRGLRRIEEVHLFIEASEGPARETFVEALIFVRNLARTVKSVGTDTSSLALAVEAAAGIVNLSDGAVAARVRRKRART